jgi:pimeloyl-ACP methyl ester carboxylesterase
MVIAKLYNDQIGIRISAHLYLPNDVLKCKKILVSVHGKNRNSSHYRNIFIPHLTDRNILIIAPRFKAEKIRHKEALIYGNTHIEKFPDLLQPKDLWTFTMIQGIIQAIADFTKIKYDSVDIFGHSAGAQFVQRLPFFYNIPKINNLIAANPGWYTFPDATKKFPYGVKGILGGEEMKKAFLSKMIFITGTEDTSRRYLRRKNLESSQGANRHERALVFYDFSQEVAKRHGYKINWQIDVVKGLRHSAKKSAAIASQYI